MKKTIIKSILFIIFAIVFSIYLMKTLSIFSYSQTSYEFTFNNDLVTTAIYEDGEEVYSSAIAFYNDDLQYFEEFLAKSIDKGSSWTKYILKNELNKCGRVDKDFGRVIATPPECNLSFKAHATVYKSGLSRIELVVYDSILDEYTSLIDEGSFEGLNELLKKIKER